MQAYTDYFAGKLDDEPYDPAALESVAGAAAQGGGGIKPRFAA